ncbi:MAG: hypothetical protein M4579_004757 [Chaenotheca gracillima]|nr:MAG: hypothetical protein M4579_004757 [Chaenotheca gracillima]
MNPSSAPAPPSSTSSTTNPSNNRPRNRRFHSSALDSELSLRPDDGSAGSSRLISPATSPRPSRAVSPIPSKHPSRPVSSNAARNVASSSNGRPPGGPGLQPSQRTTSSSSFTSGLWGNSWTTLQGLASNVLGSDAIPEENKDKPDASMKPSRRKKLPQAHQPHKRTYSTNVQGNWGPPPQSAGGTQEIAGGSKESREALVRARKREDMLSANGHAFPDLNGRFKRRTSDDWGPSSSAPPIEHEREAERDALVYVHHVQPRDTLAGVILRYNCQPAVFRKANRMWPNDSIQVRKTVLLPVDACGIKGKPVQEPLDLVDLLDSSEDPEGSTASQAPDIWAGTKSTAAPQASLAPSSPPLSSSTVHTVEEPPWQHYSWVQFEGQTSPVEIARLSRRTLGYFPPSRRKSLSFSDLDTPPSASLDLPRPSIGHRPPSPGASGRQSSTTGRPRKNSSSHFAQQMHGPGGVGTLGGRVSNVGPKQDSLNKFFANHLPDLAPKESLESLLASSGTVPPVGGPATGLDNVGAALEGWMRKLARGAAAMVENPGSVNVGLGGSAGTGINSASNNSRGVPGGGRGRRSARNGSGDLIELTDGLDLDGGASRERSTVSLGEGARSEDIRRADSSSAAEIADAALATRRRRDSRKKGD